MSGSSDERSDPVTARARILPPCTSGIVGGPSAIANNAAVQGRTITFAVPGRLTVKATVDGQDLIEKVWSVVALRVPAGYELVVRAPAPRPLAGPAPEALSRAA